jgi:hypothetical protein
MPTRKELIMDWHALRIPFHASDVDFRPGATTKDKTKAIGLAYVDKRIYEDRLDDFVGPSNWSVEYRQLGDKGIICRLTIDGVVREDVGEFASDDVASFPTAVAQAFKRACSAFGLGRYLYSLPQVWAEYDADRRRFTEPGMAQLRNSLNRGELSGMPKNPQNRQTTPTLPRQNEVVTAPMASPATPPAKTSNTLTRIIERIDTLLVNFPEEQRKLPSKWQDKPAEELIDFGKKLATMEQERLIASIDSLMLQATSLDIEVDMPTDWHKRSLDQLTVLENQLADALKD